MISKRQPVPAAALERENSEEEVLRWNELLEQMVEERTAELQAANEELKAFSYSVSHDLRTPLRHINGFAKMLLERAPGKLSEEEKRNLLAIIDAAHRMDVLIGELLKHSRVCLSEMHRQPVPMNKLVKEVLGHLRRDCEERDIRWTIGALPEVCGDPTLLRQIVVNLVSNALKYTRTRHEARITIGCVATEDEYVFFIKDNGVGFNPRHAHKLFGVFHRLHSESEFEGTGVGLANVRRAAQRHGGWAWAKGAVNHGATFYFSLPKKPAEQSAGTRRERHRPGAEQ